jgi:hypothetical protein
LTSLPLQKSSTGTVIPTVLDTQGNGITVSGLTWLSSQPGVATARTGGVVTAVNPGGTAITAVCDPPSCNTNLDPIYPVNVVNATVTGSSTSNTVYVTSTGCFGVAVSCQTSLIPIDTQSNTAGTAITLPSAPNSLVIDDAGTNAFMGTVGGLRQFNIAAIAFKTAANVKGNVLAVSPDANLVVVSDTADTPNVVSVVNVKSSSSTPLLLSGVTAAVFSPDSTIAYLLSGSTLYLYSTTHPLQTITLPGPATGAAFLATGAFGFVASTPSTVSLFNACNSTPATSPNTSTVSVSAPAMMAALPDGKTMAVVNSPGFSSIAVSTPGIGCPPGETATAAFHSFGQGSFTPKQLLVSSDGNRLYVISDLDRVMVYDFTSNSARAIALNPSATPLSAALTRSGTDLYVGASDGTVHHLDTSTSFSDVGQIPVKLCSNASISCPPNLLAARP